MIRTHMPTLMLMLLAVTAAAEDLHMLTPAYYQAGPADPFRQEVDAFVVEVSAAPLRHPLMGADGIVPAYETPPIGEFGAGRGPDGTAEHHPAVDMHLAGGATEVPIRAAHGGVVHVYRDVTMYRHHVTVTADVRDDQDALLGKLVTINAHVDLDLDAADEILIDGVTAEPGDLLSAHLYTGTMGGPHLHFEIRYYRAADVGDEIFYAGLGPAWHEGLTEPSAGPWQYGFWDPDVGYGFGNPTLHGVVPNPTAVDDGMTPAAPDFGLGAAPNPFNPRTTVSFELQGSARVDLTVVDLTGRRLRRLLHAYLPAGSHQIAWDGCDDQGRALPSGIYLTRLASGPEGAVTKLALVR